MRSSSILSSALVFALTSSAWPTGLDRALDMVRQEVAPFYKRASPSASTSFDTDFTGIQGNTATTVSSSTGTSDASNSDATTTSGVKETGPSSGKITGSPSGKTTSGGGAEPTTQTFNAEDPAGGITMITPAITTTTYYKISDYITFAWNYTSLSATPSAVDILASCSTNSATYTIALNQSITASTQAVTWDTNAWQSSAGLSLPMAEYTLIIYDSQQAVTAAPSPGYLAAYSQLHFGMYMKQPYTPLAGYICATCNGAMSAAEVQTLWFLLGTAGVTVISFGWFTGVAGLW